MSDGLATSVQSAPRHLRERLAWDPVRGQVCDGPRRYLLMRPDVLMGAVVAMTPAYRADFLEGWAASTCAHGADSLRAYAASVGGDRQALIDATTAAAADLGWGRWHLRWDDALGSLHLAVTGSPFVAGWQSTVGDLVASEDAPPPQAVCAPIRGMLQALAEVLCGGPARAEETDCAACSSGRADAEGDVTTCRFTARRVAP